MSELNEHPYRKGQTPPSAPTSVGDGPVRTEIPLTLTQFNQAGQPRGFYSGQSKSDPSTPQPATGWHANSARVYEVSFQSEFAPRTEAYTKTSILEDELRALEQMRDQLQTLIGFRQAELDGLPETPCGLTCSCGTVLETELDFANHYALSQGPMLKNLGNCKQPSNPWLCYFCFESKYSFEPDMGQDGVTWKQETCNNCNSTDRVCFKSEF